MEGPLRAFAIALNITSYFQDNSNNRTVLGRVQRQFTSATTLTVNILRARCYPTFSAATFNALLPTNTLPVSNVLPAVLLAYLLH